MIKSMEMLTAGELNEGYTRALFSYFSRNLKLFVNE